MEEGLLRLGVQGAARRPRQGLPAAPAVPRVAREPAAAGGVATSRPIQVHTNFTNTVKRVTTFTLDDLLIPEQLEQLGECSTEPEAFRAAETPEQVTEKAAAGVREAGQRCCASRARIPTRRALPDPHPVLPVRRGRAAATRGPVQQAGAATRTRPAEFTAPAAPAVRRHATGGFFGADDIRTSTAGCSTMTRCSSSTATGWACWSAPAGWTGAASSRPSSARCSSAASTPASARSWGALHQPRRHSADRGAGADGPAAPPLGRGAGAGPRRWRTARDAAAGGQRTTAEQRARLLAGFAGRSRRVRVLDPACGSGNFLYVALKQLLDLEKEVIAVRRATHGLTGFFPTGGPGAAARHRDQRLRPRAGRDHGLDRLHPVAARTTASGTAPSRSCKPLDDDHARWTPSSPTTSTATRRTRVAGGGCDHRQPAVLGRQQDPAGARR